MTKLPPEYRIRPSAASASPPRSRGPRLAKGCIQGPICVEPGQGNIATLIGREGVSAVRVSRPAAELPRNPIVSSPARWHWQCHPPLKVESGTPFAFGRTARKSLVEPPGALPVPTRTSLPSVCCKTVRHRHPRHQSAVSPGHRYRNPRRDFPAPPARRLCRTARSKRRDARAGGVKTSDV